MQQTTRAMVGGLKTANAEWSTIARLIGYEITLMTDNAQNALGHLRSATASLHDELERDLQVVARLRCPEHRTALVDGYADMQRCAATATSPWLDAVPGLDQLARPALTDRLPCGLGPDQATAPALSTRAEALGFHYVMMGSALGGRVIMRELEREGVDTADLGFLNPYGARTGEIWRELLGVLEGALAGNAAALDQAGAGARKAYTLARACLTNPVPG
jgi:heme oxygenase